MPFKQYALPSFLSVTILVPGIGGTKFGSSKIIDYVYQDDSPAFVKKAFTIPMMISTGIVLVATRVPTIFRYFSNIQAAEAKIIPRENLLENAYTPPQLRENASSSVSLNPRAPLDDALLAEEMNEPLAPPDLSLRVIEVPASPHNDFNDLAANAYQQYTRFKIVRNFVLFIGYSALTYAAILSYLGSITLFESWGNDPSEQNYPKPVEILLIGLLHLAGFITVATKLFVSYHYNLKTILEAGRNASEWFCDPQPTIPRYKSLMNYAVTLSIGSFNISSAFFVAFYMTEQTLLKIPYIKDQPEFIETFAVCSGITSFLNESLTKSSSVRNALNAWYYHREDLPKIDLLNKQRLFGVKVLNTTLFIAGSLDSIGTGLNTMVSIVNASNSLFKSDRYSGLLLAYAILSAISSGIFNGANSVRRGYREFLNNEVFDHYAKKGVFPNDQLQKLEGFLPAHSPSQNQLTFFKNPPASPSNAIPEVASHSAHDIDLSVLSYR